MTLIPVERTAMHAELKEKAAAHNWVAVNIRTGIHLVRTGAQSYLLRVPLDTSQNFLEAVEELFSAREYTDYTILGATGQADAIAIAHFLLQASNPIETISIETNEEGQKEKEPAASALAV